MQSVTKDIETGHSQFVHSFSNLTDEMVQNGADAVKYSYILKKMKKAEHL